MKSYKELSLEIAKREAKKSLVGLGNIREILSILVQLLREDPNALLILQLMAVKKAHK